MKKLLFLTLIATSAYILKAQSPASVKINPYQNSSVAEIFESYRIVPLQFKKGTYLSPLNVKYIQKNKDTFIVHDMDKNALLLFNNDGQYIAQISDGIGIFDFDVYDNSIFVLYNSKPEKIKKYDTKGSLLAECTLDEWYKNMVVVSGNEIMLFSNYSNNKGYNYVIYDFEKSKSIRVWEPMEHEHFTFFIKAFYRVGEKITAVKPYNHNIYEYCGNQLCTMLNIDFATKDRLPDVYGVLKKSQKIDKAINGGKIVNVVIAISGVTKTDNATYVCYDMLTGKGMSYCRFLCSINHETGVTSNIPMPPQTDTKFPVYGDYSSLCDGYCINYTTASAIINSVPEGALNSSDIEKLKNTENLVIVEFKLK